MILTLAGTNTFGLQADLHKLVEKFVAEHGDLALERVDGQEADMARLQEALSGLPFLASKKLVVLRAPSAQKQFMTEAERLLIDLPETNDVIIVEPKLDKRSSYYKFLKSKTDFKEFGELDINGLASWLVREAKALQGTISSNDARYLVERVGTSQQMLSNELAKLVLYDPMITRSTIDLLTDAAPQSTIFQLLEAAFAGNTKRALSIYTEQRALKVEPPQIVAMLAWQLHVLAILKAAGDRSVDQVAKDAHMSPYVLGKSANIARHLSVAKLKQLVADLLQIDTRTKREALDTDEALQLYLLKLAS